MADFTNIQLPPPSNWQEFERLCHLIWREIWGDKNTQLNGRTGQPQHGVDVFGLPRDQTRYAGIQCKGKDGRYGGEVTEEELREEIEKAQKFQPPLGEFILATTANSDAKVQEVARQITLDHRNQGLFDVCVLAWPEIHSRLAAYPQVIDIYYPELGPTAHKALATGERIEQKQEVAFEAQQSSNKELLAEIHAFREDFRSATFTQKSDDLDREIGAEIDQCRDLIRQNRPRTALELLERVRGRIWHSAGGNIRFRIITNSGAAKLGLGDEVGAAADFLQAYEIDSSTDKAHSNRVLALLLRNDPQSAVVAAQEATKKHPSSALVWASLIKGHTALGDDVEIEKILPKEVLEDIEVLFSLSQRFGQAGNLEKAEAYLRKGYARAPDASEFKMALGECLAEQVSRAGKLYLGSPLSDVERAKLDEAVSLLGSAWASLRDTELAAVSDHCPANLSSVLIVLGERERADETVNQGLIRRPDSPDLLRRKLQLLLDSGKNDEAKRIFQNLKPDSVSDYVLLHAEVLRRSGDIAEAIVVLEQFITKPPDAELAQVARCLLIELLAEKFGFAKARERVQSLLEQGPPDYRSLLAAAAAAKEDGDSVAAEAYLAKAKDIVDATTDTRAWLMLADLLVDWELYQDAIPIYRKHCSPLNDTRSLKRYVGALMETDRRREIVDLSERLPNTIKEKAFYLRVLGELSFQVGDLTAARQYFDKCLDKAPQDFHVRLRWAEILITLNDKAPVEAYLARQDELHASLRVEELIHLSRLHRLLGRPLEAVRIAYEARRRYPGSKDAHLNIVGLLLSDRGLSLPQDEATLIATDMAFAVLDREQKERVFIIEDRPLEDLLATEIRPDHSLAKRSLGLRRNDVVLLSQSAFFREEGTIVWVKQKYLYALHDTMETFETRFPETGAMFRVPLPKAGTPEERLSPILHSVESYARRIAEVEKLYTEKQLPICVVAKLIGRNVLDVWRGFVVGGKFNIAVCLGSHEEREIALGLVANSKEGFILEPISLFLLHTLSLLDSVQLLCGKLAVTQAALDEYRKAIAESDIHRDGYMTIGKQGEQFVRQEITAEDVAKHVGQLESVLKWAEEHCEIVPAIPKRDIEESDPKGAKRLMGRAYYETLLAASGSNRVLISDDWHLRRLGKGSFGVESVWTQPVLLACVSRGVLERNKYSNTIAMFVESRYHFTSINAEILCDVARETNWIISPRLEKLMATLELKTNELQSLVGVVAEFLHQIWSREKFLISSGEARKLTYSVLAGVNPGGSPHCHLFLRVLGVRVILGQLPEVAWRVVIGWYQGHFLIHD